MRLLFYIILSLSFYSCKQKDNKITEKSELVSNFTGKWAFYGNDEQFLLTIASNSTGLTGNYCYVTQQSAIIDCLDSIPNFIYLDDIKDSCFTTKFRTGYGKNFGIIRICKIGKNKIKYDILDIPDGEFYCPHNKILKRI